MDTDVQQVKDRINIVDVVGQYVQLRRAGRTWTGKCPFHKERTPSFHVSPERGTYKCFGCGEGGDIFSFVQKMDGVDFPAALRQFAQQAGVTLSITPKVRAPEQVEHEERLIQVCEDATLYFENVLSEHISAKEYLHTRGLSTETIKEWRIGYAPPTWESLSRYLKEKGYTNDEIVDAGFALKSEKKPGEIFDRFRGRIMFPISDQNGRPIAVSGRFFEKVPGQTNPPAGGEPAKYVNSPETALFKKSRVLYGLNVARPYMRKLDCVLLVEGQFDLLLCHQSGLPYTVALSGTALTPEHLSILGRLSKRMVLALDGDAAGVRSGLKSALMAVTEGFEVKIPQFPEGKDPADIARENPELLKAAVRASQSAVAFFLDALKVGTKDARAYTRAVEEHLLPLVRAHESSIERDQYIRLIASKLMVSEEAVRTEVMKKAAPPASTPSLHTHDKKDVVALGGIEKKAAMLWWKYDTDSSIRQKLEALLEESDLERIRTMTEVEAEEMRFRFDSEVGEHTTEEAIAADMLSDIERLSLKRRLKNQFL